MDTGKSPSQATVVKVGMDFFDALREISNGNVITKMEWGDDSKFFCFLKDTLLMIHNETGDHTWTISEGDMRGTDYVVVEKK
jgi:hypothetical protein